MVAFFCLRLACGLIAALLLLSPAQVNPRFFRVHFFTGLGLTAVALVFLRDETGPTLWLALGGALGLTFLGSVVWHLEGAPGGRALIFLSVPVLASALLIVGQAGNAGREALWLYADDLASAALLGTAATAMLIGHSYLIAPAMSLTPLLRMLAALGVTTLLRMGLAGAGLWLWTRTPANASVPTETLLWLPVRWGLGFV